MSKKILIIGQDELIKNSLAAELEKKDYIIEITVNLVLGIEKIKDKEIDLVILNAGLKKINALETGKRIKKIKPAMPVLIINLDYRKNLSLAIESGAYDIIESSQDIKAILNAAADALKKKVPPPLTKKIIKENIKKYIDKNAYLLKTDTLHTAQCHLKPRLVSQAVENACLECKKNKINNETCRYNLNDEKKKHCLQTLFVHGMVYAVKYLDKLDKCIYKQNKT